MNRSKVLFLVLCSLLTSAVHAEEKELTNLVSTSPDGRIEIITQEMLPLNLDPDSKIRSVGKDDDEPSEVFFMEKASGKGLGAVASEAGGPVSAYWRSDSKYVLLYWSGYRYNWYRCLVGFDQRGVPIVVDPYRFPLDEFIQKDKRSALERYWGNLWEYTEEPDYPISKMSWRFAPIDFKENGNLMIDAIELARDPRAPHPFEQSGTGYEIEVALENNGIRPIKLWQGRVRVFPPAPTLAEFDRAKLYSLKLRLDFLQFKQLSTTEKRRFSVVPIDKEGTVIRELPVSGPRTNLYLDFSQATLQMPTPGDFVEIYQMVQYIYDELQKDMDANQAKYREFPGERVFVEDLELYRLTWDPTREAWCFIFNWQDA